MKIHLFVFTTPNPVFKVTILFNVKKLKNDTR